MIGLQILKRHRCIDASLVQAFHGLPVANISDSMSRMTAGGAGLRPMHKAGYLSGPALTVKTRPGDNLMIHKAIALAQPGDVIVVDGGGDLSNALIGELMVTTAKRRGVAGFVMNGAIRDLDMIAAGDFPVFAAGVTHRGPYKDGPGEINVPVAIDGMVIHPGDLVVGDADGVLCVPIDQAPIILEATQAKGVAERKTLQQIAEGTLDVAWIDATLKRIGCDPYCALTPCRR
ncbi:MAG: RraA family protein [Polaromonas sp.]|uniref:RraA family protein n=1 Tax=Polaromonas sp. TaxID=1869339 RepID=UPI0027322C33|nr:RraA family protein [Polaromonas sp.]MDP2819562.1 RraA family protein [Polaromonas sp.]